MSIICKKHGVEFDPTKGEGCPQCIAEKDMRAKACPEPGCIRTLGHEGVHQAFARIFDLPEELEFDGLQTSGTPDPNAWRTGEEEVKVEPIISTALININPIADEVIKALIVEAEKALKYADARVIKSEEDKKLASDDLKLIGGVMKAFTTKQTEYTKPLNDYKTSILATFKEILAPLIQAEKITKDKMLAYNAEVTRRIQEEEEINRKRMEAAEQEMRLKGELTESVNLVEVEPEAKKGVTTAFSSAGERANWTYEVVDFALLPDFFKLEASSLLNTHAKSYHNTKEVPGVIFKNVPIIARGK